MLQVIADLGTLKLFGSEIPLRVFGYGAMLVVGFILGIYLARWRARRSGENPDVITNCGILALVAGVLGARAAYVIENWSTFATADNRLAEIINITGGGLIYYGGLSLATATVLLYLWIKRLSVRRYLDILAASIMLGLAFGRAGCILNGCCFGGPCRADWALALRFPMFSRPLIKLNGTPGPFSDGADGPSPLYGDQLSRGVVNPDERLVNLLSPAVLHPPRYLHGRLGTGQLATMLGNEESARKAFYHLAGPDGLLSENEFIQAVRNGNNFLRGSEHWDEARSFDTNRDDKLSFDDSWRYLQFRRDWLVGKFDADADGKLNPAERQLADSYLQEDLYALAGNEWSQPVRPAQPLGLINALLLAALLMGFYRLRRREGQVFALMLVLYPITRFVLESIRADNPHDLLHGILTHNQHTSLIMLAGGIGLFVLLGFLKPSAGPLWAERLGAEERNQRTGRHRQQNKRTRKDRQ